MKNIEVKTHLMGYGSDFLATVRKGWGCGYVIIPKNHPIMAKAIIEQNSSGYGYYLQPEGFDQEITYSEIEEDGSLKIGFDTAHSWNDSSHDKEWVNEKTEELKKIVEDFTTEDARKLAQDFLNNHPANQFI